MKQSQLKTEQDRTQVPDKFLDDILEGDEEYKKRTLIQDTFNQGQPFKGSGGVLINPAFLPGAQGQGQTQPGAGDNIDMTYNSQNMFLQPQFPFNFGPFGMGIGIPQVPTMNQMAPIPAFGAPMTFGCYMPNSMSDLSSYMNDSFFNNSFSVMSSCSDTNFQQQSQMSLPMRATAAAAKPAEDEADNFLSNLADELPLSTTDQGNNSQISQKSRNVQRPHQIRSEAQILTAKESLPLPEHTPKAPKAMGTGTFLSNEILDEAKTDDTLEKERSVSEKLVKLELEEGEVDPNEEPVPSTPCYNCLSKYHTMMECKEWCGHCGGSGHLTIACERMILGRNSSREYRRKERYDRKDRKERRKDRRRSNY